MQQAEKRKPRNLIERLMQEELVEEAKKFYEGKKDKMSENDKRMKFFYSKGLEFFLKDTSPEGTRNAKDHFEEARKLGD
jgi:hypothetical protein